MANETKMHVAFASVNQLGHLSPLIPFMKELQDRGHKVTIFMSEEPQYVERLAQCGLKDIEMIGVPLPKMGGKPNPGKMIKAGGPGAYLSGPLFDAIVNHYRSAKAPAAFIADFFCTAAMDAADHLGVPVIVCFPNPLGLGIPLYAPQQRGLGQKILALVAAFGESVLARLLLAGRNKERRLRSLPPMVEQDLYPCYTMKRPALCTWGLGFEYAALQSPLLTYVGLTEPTAFPDVTGPLAQWLDQQHLPVVYVAFGTNHVFTKDNCQNLFSALEELTDVAILWSLPQTQQALLPLLRHESTVHLEAFVPQYAVLNHPKVVAFVTHCGANSAGEAILSEKPMICCPVMADQPCNAARIASAGAGVFARSSSGVHVTAAVSEVLSNLSGFQEKVRKLKGILISHGGAKRGADVIEIIAAHGYDHMVPSGQRTSWSRIGLALLCGCIAYLAAKRKQLFSK